MCYLHHSSAWKSIGQQKDIFYLKVHVHVRSWYIMICQLLHEYSKVTYLHYIINECVDSMGMLTLTIYRHHHTDHRN